MTPAIWPCQTAGNGISHEYALTFDRGRPTRILIVPALFDEANRLRRFTVEVMRRLDAAGIDSFLPDFPGTNESLQPLEQQSGDDWRRAMHNAAGHFGVTHILGIRGGCLFAPTGFPGWHYAPVEGSSLLRQMIRARILASREAGIEETREGLLERGLQSGIELAGYRISRDLFAKINELKSILLAECAIIEQAAIGGSGLWLKAEPGESAEQADALATIVSANIAA